MIPGEYRLSPDDIELNVGRRRVTLDVTNTGDRPIQVGSHFGFFEVNRALHFDREQAFGMRLDIPAGTAVRFEPGEQKPVTLVAIGGTRETFGLNNLSQGATNYDEPVSARLTEWEQL
ncbi:urease subunit beta [Abditibacteriota bacterium]|nr:urease subunit beta [Abditibacteriota bacterium]